MSTGKKSNIKGEVMIYMPYCPENKHKILPDAIQLYHQGSLEGKRVIEGSENIPFIATWSKTKLPSEKTFVRILFNQNADLSYEISLTNSDFINYLIEVIDNHNRSKAIAKRKGESKEHPIDFPQSFYRELLYLAS